MLQGETGERGCFRKIFLNDEYRFPFEADPRLIMDGGANIGLATLYYYAVYRHAKIYAVEPVGKNFDLERNWVGLNNVVEKNGTLVEPIKGLAD